MPRSVHATEAQEQETLIEWAWMVPLPEGGKLAENLIMIPNENLISYIGGQLNRIKYLNRLRMRGFRKGASDLILAVPRGQYHGLWVEMKKQRAAYSCQAAIDAAVSGDQRLFGDRMIMFQYGFITPFGWEMAGTLINRYLDGTFRGERVL